MDAKTCTNGRMTALAFVGGAVLGAVAGLLWAPRPGRETRERISELARQARSKMTCTEKRDEASTRAA